jgi:hypothetical protein
VAGRVCPECRRALKETAPDLGYYCVFCHLAVTLSHAGSYALIVRDDAQNRRRSSRVPLESLEG